MNVKIHVIYGAYIPRVRHLIERLCVEDPAPMHPSSLFQMEALAVTCSDQMAAYDI